MQVVYGTASARARWRICTSYVNGNLGLAVGRLFVKETFRETAKNDVSFNVGTKQQKKLPQISTVSRKHFPYSAKHTK